MSCSCNSNPCRCPGSCDPSNEPLSSALNNFITSFFGSLTKSCVNNVVVWTLPCNLEAGDPSFPRQAGEGIACYFLRFIETFQAAQQFSVGSKGYFSRTLVGNVVLFRSVDVVNQDFTGTLASPSDIVLDSNGAVNGDEFFLSFTNLVITATNNVEILSDSTSLLVIDTPGTLNGFFKAVYTGTAWKLTLTSQNLS